ncbi:MAG TPA: NAD-glutamate dehydrogenase domain-containing protein [Gammaproteobacteria bacterium]|nr:NAD-glutamate dehydrogenase domain-containing protein [Gammaproteobacteria bacterium]
MTRTFKEQSQQQLIKKLSTRDPFQIDLYEDKTSEFPLHLKLFQYGKPLPLSDVLPMIENMGLRTYSENPSEITRGNETIWISDFSVTYTGSQTLDLSRAEKVFEEAFAKVRLGLMENDGFNRLVLAAGLSWRDVTLIRAYAKYLHQTGFRFNQAYIEQAVTSHADIIQNSVALFHLKFAPVKNPQAAKKIDALNDKIQTRLEAVTSLDDDRILRRFWQLVNATLRTNYFQTTSKGDPKDYLSFKLRSADVPELPLPHPLYEIFVYSPRFEGIHLRSEKVARGGIRWSDRREDFRTEILGLMKAQKVKNAVIVPSGAKGGFVLKATLLDSGREALHHEVITCYQSFIRGLLDLTDNLHGKKVIPPEKTVCLDDDDPYLVVAADKGTASFSDIANGIAKEYNFWLGDAFASGGSEGYDHKKMGITARGAWESVKRHFREIDINIEEQDFTAVGIGDMSGDVFGNGMIYTPHIKLIAAFDHRNIFIDPNPHPQKSFDERTRLFNLETSSWEDYNAKLISAGGGIFKRSSKSITLTANIKKALGIEENALAPNELIRAILKAPVDLLFNGGIGTYVKASTESHADVGDKTNEFCRINGDELRCKVVGEGGNLGFTQLGRIEYALNNGLINTDFIDNSAGVDCSDHEVNIKILLDKEVKKDVLTEKKRNQLLMSMTGDVAKLVLHDNYSQALVMSFSSMHAIHYTGLYLTYMRELETAVHLDRAVEFLPDEKKLLERRANDKGLTRPEIAVLLAYTKIYIKNELVKSDVPDDPYFIKALESAFPTLLMKSYVNAMEEHPLRREIIATQLSNQLVNSVGITFVYRLQTETGASVADIVRAYMVAANAYGTDGLQKLIDSLNFKISIKTQYELLHHIRQLLNLATRWFLRGTRMQGDIQKIIDHYKKSIVQLEEIVSTLMVGATKEYMDKIINQFVEAGIQKNVARTIAIARAMYTALNVIEVATQHKLDLIQTAQIYFDVGGQFNLVWFRDQIASDSREGHWNTMARLALRDELDSLQKKLSIVISKNGKKKSPPHKLISHWLSENHTIKNRWETLLELLHGSTNMDYTMFFIVLRELSDMVQV